MSTDGWEAETREPTKREEFERKLKMSYELYFNLGSTFFLLPELTMNEFEILGIDWLWLHIGILRH